MSRIYDLLMIFDRIYLNYLSEIEFVPTLLFQQASEPTNEVTLRLGKRQKEVSNSLYVEVYL